MNHFSTFSIRIFFWFLFTLLYLALPTNGYSRIWYVMYDGGPGWGPIPQDSVPFVSTATNWNKAGKGIRQTIDAATDGDEIWVAGGDVNGDGLILKANDHYRMDFTMQLTKNIKIIGGFPRPGAKSGVLEPTMADRDMVLYATIFDGSDMAGDKKLFNMANPLTNATFDGFYVINGSSGWGAGIYMQSGLTIANCVFANNNATDNTNPALAGGGAVHATGGTLVNCIFTNNQAKNKGGAAFLEGTAAMINCTVVNSKVETAGDNGSAIYMYGTGVKVINTVTWNNTGATYDISLGNGATNAQVLYSAYNTMATADASCIQISTTNSTGTNPPYFVTPSNTATPGVVAGWQFSTLGNWYLKNALSSLWDKGENTIISALRNVDIVNRPRIRNGIVDIGAYEVQPLWVRNAVIAPKTYNGSATGTMSDVGNINGVIAPDVVTIGSVSVVYSDKNAATPKNVRLTYTLSGADALKYFVEPIDTVDQILKRGITFTAGAKSKVYSNNPATDPALTYTITSGSFVVGDNATGALTRVAGESVIAPGPNYQIQQGSIDLGSNYNLTYIPANLTITQKELTISGLSIADRGYVAGDLNAPIASWGSLVGIVGSDDVSLNTTGITASYANDAAGGNKPVTFSATPTLVGAQSGNYYLTMPAVTGNIGVSSTTITTTYPDLTYDGSQKVVTSTHTPNDPVNDIVTTTYYLAGNPTPLAGAPKDAANYEVEVIVSGPSFSGTIREPFTIVQKALSATVANGIKTYDNTKNSVVPTITLNGVVAADVANVSVKVNATQPSATYTSEMAGVGNKTIKISGIELTGTRAFNYTIPTTAENNTSTINPKVVTIIADSTSKVYDGTTAITKKPELSFSPSIYPDDDVTADFNSTDASFDTKNWGVNKTVTINNIVLSGDSLINYSIINSAVNNNSIITRLSFPNVSIDADSVTKIYDGNRNAPLPIFSLIGIKAGDDVTISTNGSSYGLYDSKDVGINKEVGFVGLIIGGTDANNYIIAPNYTSNSNVVLPRPLSDTTYIEVADTTKTYDALTSIATPTLTIKGLATGDTIDVIRTGTASNFDNKNAGNGKTVIVSNGCWSFSNPIAAANYTWASQYTNTNSSITPFDVTVTPDGGQQRKYDEAETTLTYTTTPTLLPANEQLNGQLSRAAGNDVGIYQITQGTITNANNPNYNITFTPGVTYEIYSGIEMEKKWGYTLVINNTTNSYKAYQWYKDGVALPGETKQYYGAERFLCGVYKVLVTFNDGTEVFSQDRDETATCGIVAQTISLYPNRLKAGANITINTNSESDDDNYTISIYSISGVLVHSVDLNSLKEASLIAPIVAGSYIVKIYNHSNELATYKIVVY